MKNKLITQIQTSMASQLNVAQLEELGKVLTNALNCVEITEKRCPTANSAPASTSTPSPDQGDRAASKRRPSLPCPSTGQAVAIPVGRSESGSASRLILSGR